MRDGALSTITSYIAPPAAPADTIPDTVDPLSAPTVETLLPGALALLPRGAAWGTPDNEAPSLDSFHAKVWRALLVPFTDLYANAYDLTLESRALTVDVSLADWEQDHGLPDRCLPPVSTVSGRKAALLKKLRSLGTITPQDFVRLAHDLGYEITIEEPYVFECGLSECGGDHGTGSKDQEFYWIVHIQGQEVEYFRIGEGEVGLTPLFEIQGINELECVFLRDSPAVFKPVFWYSE